MTTKSVKSVSSVSIRDSDRRGIELEGQRIINILLVTVIPAINGIRFYCVTDDPLSIIP